MEDVRRPPDEPGEPHGPPVGDSLDRNSDSAAAPILEAISDRDRSAALCAQEAQLPDAKQADTTSPSLSGLNPAGSRGTRRAPVVRYVELSRRYGTKACDKEKHKEITHHLMEVEVPLGARTQKAYFSKTIIKLQ